MIFCLVLLLIIESEVWKFPTVTTELIIFPFNSVSFWFTSLGLSGIYMLMIFISFKWLLIIHLLVAHSSLVVWDPMDCRPPDSSVHGIFQARILEWVAIFPSGDLPSPGIKPSFPVSPALQADSLPTEPSGKPNGCMSFFFFLPSLFAHILVGLGEEAEVYTHVHSICCLIGSPQNPQFSNPVLLMSASSCKLVLISKWKASRNVTWFTQLEDPLSKNAFGVRLRLNDQSEYNRLTIVCGLGTHSPAPQSQPRPFWWNTSAHKQKVPLLSLWNKHEGLLGLWS